MKIDKKNWKKVKFGDVVTYKKVTVDPETSGLERYIAGEHMNTDDLHIRSWGIVGDGYLGPAFHSKFEKGDILYGSRRTYLKKVAVADFDGITSNTTFVLKENTDLVVNGLIPFLMLSDTFTEHSIKNSKGSVNPYINFKDIAKFEFLLPSKEHQAELTELLGAADAVVEAYNELLTKFEVIQTVYALANYQDKLRPLSTITSLAEINPSIPKSLPDPESEVSFLAMADVSEDGKIINKQKRKLKDVRKGFTYFGEGDILFAKITPCMENGKGALATELLNKIGFGSTEFHIIRPFKESDKLYCYYISKMKLFRTEAEKLMVGSAGQKRVQSDFFDYFTFHIPQEKQRQKFGNAMEKIETQKEKVIELIKTSKGIQNQLLNQIFST